MKKVLFRVHHFVFLTFFAALANIPAIANNQTVLNEEKVFVFPEEDRRELFLETINNAKNTLYVAAYRFTCVKMFQALLDAAKRGVKIKFLRETNIWLQPGIPAEAQDAEDLAANLIHPNIELYEKPTWVHQTHLKMIIADNKVAIVTTSNFSDMERFCRDFAIPVTNPEVVKELTDVFLADIEDRFIVPQAPNHEKEMSVVWGPDFQRTTLLKMIMEAAHFIQIYQQSLQDVGIARALAKAARNGVSVRIIMTKSPFGGEDKNIPNHQLLTEAGAQVRLCNPDHRYIHAKVMRADDMMYLGSGNFYTPSIDETRELGILTSKPAHIHRVHETFEVDWENSVPFQMPPEAH